MRSILRVSLVCGLVLAMAGSCETTYPDTCVAATALTLGSTTSGTMTVGDCKLAVDRGDLYTLTLADQTTVRFAVSASESVKLLKLRVRTASTHDTTLTVAADAPNATSFTSYVVLPAGTLTVDVTARSAGNYSITPTAAAQPSPAGCFTSSTAGHVSAAVGITLDGDISNNDCFSAGYYADSYDVYMIGGQLRTITVTASIGTSVELHDDAGVLLTSKSLNTAGANVITFTPFSTGRYHVAVIGTPSLATGSYSLKIQ